MLKLSGLNVFYGPIQALHGISLEVQAGEIAAIIGAHGAGKTTTLRAISGLIRSREESIYFEGRSIDGMAAEKIVGLGIAHVPQGRRIFPGLTVAENLNLATASWRKRGMSIDGDLARVYELFPVLKQREKQLGWSLSGGEQQMLAVGRRIMARPKLLLLDEPSLGLAPKVVEELFETIKQINREDGTTILVVEQNAFMALSIADHGYVLEMGEVVLRGSASELMTNDLVKSAYLGE